MTAAAGVGPVGKPGVGERAAPHHRPLLSAAVAFAAGIATARALSLETGPVLCAAGIVCLMLAAFRHRMGHALRTALVLLLVGLTGAANIAARASVGRSPDAVALRSLLTDRATLCYICGRVDGEPIVACAALLGPEMMAAGPSPNYHTSFRLEVDEVESNGVVRRTSGAVRVTVRGQVETIGHGDRVRVFGWVTPLNPEHDRYAVSTGLIARASVTSTEAVRVQARGGCSFYRVVYAIKRALRRQIGTCMTDEGAMIVRATLLGEQERLPPSLRDSFAESGTTHLLAISGLNVGIIYFAVQWLGRRLLVPLRLRSVSVLVVVAMYGVMVGFGPAVARATLMIFMFELAGWFRSRPEPVNSCAVAALIILGFAPWHLFEAGFQLTFAAVLGILMFYEDLARVLGPPPLDLVRLAQPQFQSRRRRMGRRVWKQLARAVAVCAAATVAVMPLQAHYFSMVTPISVFVTLLLTVVVTLLTWLGFVFLATSAVMPAMGVALAKLVVPLAEAFMWVVKWAGDVPFGHVYVAPPSGWWVAVFYGALVVVAARRWLRLSAARAVAVPLLALSVYLGWRALVAPGPEFSTSFIDVGHGTCTVITRGRRTVVYDCGSGTGFLPRDVGRGAVANHLWRRGIKRIDLLIISHAHADHAIGAPSLAKRFPVGTVLVHESFRGDKVVGEYKGSELLAELEGHGARVIDVGAGDSVRLGDIELDVLWPPKGKSPWRLSGMNDRSLVVAVKCGGRSMLLTGDIEHSGMAGALATERERLRAEVLYVPHHGAGEQVLDQFVPAVRAEYAVISDARRDPPSAAAARPFLRGLWLYQTSRDGTVEFTGTVQGWRVRTSR